MEEKIVETFSTPQGCHLTVENEKGEIKVQGWDKPETEVIAIRHQEWAEVEIIQDGDKVIARTKNALTGDEPVLGKWLNRITSNRSPEVDYSVRVPFASNVKLKNVKGPIHVKQTQGEVRVNTVDGPATVEDVDGDAKIESVNGALHIAQFRGAADLKTVNGELKLQEGALSKLSAQTVNGNIAISATLDEEGQYTFNTVNGNCELHLPADFQARVSAHGVNLHVDCTQPAQSIRRQFGNWQGVIGPEQDDEPQAEIAFHTVNGHLSIDNGAAAATEYVAKAEAPAEPPTSPEPTEPPASIEVKIGETDKPRRRSQLEVLQRVERGEITVEEAIKLLEE